MDKYSALQYTNALQIFVKVQNIRTNGLGKNIAKGSFTQ